MKVLVACEESQRVCTEFRKLGHEAYSCDIIDCSGGHPEWHIKDDVIPLITRKTWFVTMDNMLHRVKKWDLIIAHPPCTYLTVSGNRWFNVERYGDKALERLKKRDDAATFFMYFTIADCEHVAIENPIGYMSSHYRKPDQIIHPYMFGDPVRKATCLWLKGLPQLIPTNEVVPNIISDGKYTYSGPAYYARSEDGKILSWNDPETARIRSKTFPSIARAMAEQWGKGELR